MTEVPKALGFCTVMSTPASEHYRIDPWRLRQLGAYDIPIDGREAPVYLDPRLLRRTDVPEFAKAMENVGAHFASVFADIRVANQTSGAKAQRFREAAKAKLLFPELEGLRIGFGQGDAPGKGLGKGRAKELFDLAQQFVRDDFTDPRLFEMFTVVQEGVGADLVSDMLASINREALYEYSERIARELGLPTQPFEMPDRTYQLPWNDERDEHLLFPPYAAVAEIPAFRTSKRFDRFHFSNEQIRKAISEWIKKNGSEDAVRRYLLAHREDTNTILAAYTATKPRGPDQFSGKAGARLAGREIYEALKAKLAPVRAPTTPQELESAVRDVAARFKEYVDAGKARTQLHGKSARDEKFVQDMFGNFVETFCQDRDIRISREVNDGMGPVDFLFSKGATMAAALELKLSSNTGLLRTYEHQVQAYARASGAQSKFFVVLDLEDKRAPLGQLVNKHDAMEGSPRRPHLFIIDGRNSPPASKIQKAREPLPQPGQKVRPQASQSGPVAHPVVAQKPPPKSGWELLSEVIADLRKKQQERDRARPK